MCQFFTLLFSLVVFRGPVLLLRQRKVQQLPECRQEVQRRDWLKTIHFWHVAALALVALAVLAPEAQVFEPLHVFFNRSAAKQM